MTYEQLLRSLQQHSYRNLALISDNNQRVLVGSVLRTSLQEAIVQHFNTLNSDHILAVETATVAKKFSLKKFLQKSSLKHVKSELKKKSIVLFQATLNGAGKANW